MLEQEYVKKMLSSFISDVWPSKLIASKKHGGRSWLVQNVDNEEGKMMLSMEFVVEFEGQYQQARWLLQNVDNQEGKTILSMKFVVEFQRQYQLTVSCCVEIDSSSSVEETWRKKTNISIGQVGWFKMSTMKRAR